jgi:hypothetical protein
MAAIVRSNWPTLSAFPRDAGPDEAPQALDLQRELGLIANLPVRWGSRPVNNGGPDQGLTPLTPAWG